MGKSILGHSEPDGRLTATRMRNLKFFLFFCLIVCIFMVPTAGAVWWNPLSWFAVEAEVIEPSGLDPQLGTGSRSGVVITPGRWAITKSGAEENLTVQWTQFSDTLTEFCIGFKDKAAYSNSLQLDSKDIKAVPVTKVSNSKDYSISKASLDLETTGKCFNVTHKSNTQNVSFKIGWNTVTIVASGTYDALDNPQNDNFARGRDGNLYLSYSDGGFNLNFCKSVDEGAIWTCSLIQDAAIRNNIMLGANDEIFITYFNNTVSVVYSINSTDGGSTFNTPQVITTGGGVASFSSAIGPDNIIHTCYNVGGTFYYINTSDTNTFEVAGAVDDVDFCDIAVADTGLVILTGVGTDQTDSDVWDSGDRFATRTQLSSATGGATAQIVGDLEILTDGRVYNAFIAMGDIQFCNSTLSHLKAWTCKEIEPSTAYSPQVTGDSQGNVYVLYDDISGGSPTVSTEVYLANSTDFGVNWNVRKELHTTSGQPNIASSFLFDGGNRFSETLWYAFMNNSKHILFNSLHFGNPGINFTLHTSPNETVTTDQSFVVNISIEEDRLKNLTYSLNSVNYTLYDASLLFFSNFDNNSLIGDTATRVKDLSIYGNDGKINTASVFYNATGGYRGGSYYFDGTSGNISMLASGSLKSGMNFTISLWVRLTNAVTTSSNKVMHAIEVDRPGGQDTFFIKTISVGGNPKLKLSFAGSSWSCTSASVVLPQREWHHITGVHHDTGARLYLDGNFIRNITDLQLIQESTLKMTIGSNNAGGAVWNGTVDEVRYWNRSFTHDEVNQHYMMQLKKLDHDSWTLNINQTFNATNASQGLPDGTYIYQGHATGPGLTQNSTDPWEILINATGGPPVVEDTCTPPGAGHWTVADDCYWVDDLTVPGDMSIINNSNAGLFAKLEFAVHPWLLYIETGSTLFVDSSGEIR